MPRREWNAQLCRQDLLLDRIACPHWHGAGCSFIFTRLLAIEERGYLFEPLQRECCTFAQIFLLHTLLRTLIGVPIPVARFNLFSACSIGTPLTAKGKGNSLIQPVAPYQRSFIKLEGRLSLAIIESIC